MKKISLLLVVVTGIWFSACQKDSAVPDPVEVASDFETVVASAARYAVSTDSVTVGKCKGKLTEVATADLPATVTAYIDSAYAGSEITYAAKDQSGKLVVALTLADGTSKGLLFNADGVFKEELRQHQHKAKLTKIDTTALPAGVIAYITSSYAGYSIKMAATNADGEYFVGITSGQTVKVLLFNADGTFKSELEKAEKRHKRH